MCCRSIPVAEDRRQDGNRLIKRSIATSVVYEVEHSCIAEFSAYSVSYYISQGAAVAQIQFRQWVAITFQSLKDSVVAEIQSCQLVANAVEILQRGVFCQIQSLETVIVTPKES